MGFVTCEPSMVRAVAKANRQFYRYISFESAGYGSVNDFGVSGYAVLEGLDRDVVKGALVDDVVIVGAVDSVWSVGE